MEAHRTVLATEGYDPWFSSAPLLIVPVEKPKPTRESLGARIRDLRTTRGLSQADVAQRMGSVTQKTISTWERGGSVPDALQLLQLAEVLGVRHEVFFEHRIVQSENLPPAVAAQVMLHVRAIQRLIRPHRSPRPGKPSAERRAPAEP
ncbi:MAG: helix-turn-helix transcriptional regulator [Planctomycetes bacterium]|nr:helix-turn-helix transcriptional regulator [Planctomycetota bacterium]